VTMSAARRTDLLRLTPEALAQLANLGLVKRAQRELGSGYVPALSMADNGQLDAEFPDQVRTAFAPGAGLKEASCSCGAALCRHRIAVVLHYAASAGANDDLDAAAPIASFHTLQIEQVRAQTAASLWPTVEREIRNGIRIEVELSRATDAGSPIHTARLPHATARYYAGADLAFARCDCTAQQRCEHIALGALALMQATALADARMTIELTDPDRDPRGDTRSPEFSSVPCHALLRLLLRDGLAHGAADSAAVASALSHALSSSRSLGATWLTLCLEALEQWLDAYQRRSARFAWRDGAALLRELAMRLTVAESGRGALSARAVLGLSEPMESALDRLTLLSLGLRVHADGDSRRATLAVVDGDTQTLLSLHKSWQRAADAQASELAQLDQQRLAGSLRLSRLALGSLVTTTAKRRANGELKLGQSFAGKASVAAQSGDWSRLRAPLLIESQAEHLRQQRLAIPAPLAARSALPDFHVLRVAAVGAIGFDPAAQRLHAQVADPSDAVWTVQRDHASATPGALDAIAQTLLQANPGEHPLYIAGRVQRGAHGMLIEPWALSAGAIVVPDLAAPNGALAEVSLASAAEAGDDPLAAFLIHVDESLCELLRDGLLRSRSVQPRLAELTARSRALGLVDADRNDDSIDAILQRLQAQIARLSAGEHEALDPALQDLLALAIWNSLALHALSHIDA
jgi:hypothetical protein